MKVDILLRTRDYDRDYRWIFKPEYVDRVTEDKMSFLIQMMQKSELKQYLENESLYNLYYLYDENGSALVRSGFSGSMDRQGRNIYAVEGIACPAEMNRLFWYALPHPVFFGATLKNHIFCQAFHLHMMFHISILFRTIFTQPLLTQHRLL